MMKKIMKKVIITAIAIAIILMVMIQHNRYVVNLAYMVDSKYLPYMLVSLSSVIKNKHQQTIYNVYVIAKDVEEKQQKRLLQMAQKNVHIHLYSAVEHGLDTKHLGRFSAFDIALQKLFIADYLKEINKVLYLDADTLVQQDLSTLYKTPLGHNYAAATKDGLMYQYPEHITEIGLDWRNFYFNSGVMLLNLKQIRADNIKNRAIIYFNTHQEVFGDQDILNVVFKDKVIPLSYRYNCNSTFFEEKDAAFLSEFYGEKIPQTTKAVYDNATILHFAGAKPWTSYYTQPYLREVWQRYADETERKYH